MAVFVRHVNIVVSTAALYLADEDIALQKALVHFVADLWSNPEVLLPPAAARDLTLDVVTATPLQAEDILRRIEDRGPIHTQSHTARMPWVATFISLLILYRTVNGPIPALRDSLQRISPEECRHICEQLKCSAWVLCFVLFFFYLCMLTN